jgi:hypothetical protein
VSSPIDWSAFNSGPTWDGDIIDLVIESGVVPANTVEFVLEAASNVRWWKALRVPDGLGSSWEIWTQNDTKSGRVSLWSHQVANGQSLEFKKAKVAGIHTGMYLLGGLDRLAGGSRVTFRWVQDEFPDYNGGLDGLVALSLEFVEGVGFWALPGQTFSTTVRGGNLSNASFTSAARYRIGSWPRDNTTWGRSRVDLPEDFGQDIFNFYVTFPLTAPAVSGRYPFGWRMLQEGVSWFGSAVRPRPDGAVLVSESRPNPVPPPTTTVPAIIGLLASQARDAVVAAQLQVGIVGNVTGVLDFERLRVMAQAPAAGSVVSPGTRVNFGVELASPPPPPPSVNPVTMEFIPPPPVVLLPGDPAPAVVNLRGGLSQQRSTRIWPVSVLAAVGASFTESCAGGDRYDNNCAHFLSDAFISAGYVALMNYGARCNTAARRPIRAREMREWFAAQATRTSTVPTHGTGWWAVFQLNEANYWGGHVVLLDSDSWHYYGTGWYGQWSQELYSWD